MVHLPVLFQEAMEQLAIRPDGFYIDCTFGRGGHSRGILNLLGESGRLLALDRDSDAIHSPDAQALLQDSRLCLQHSCFSALSSAAQQAGATHGVDGILLDLGVSSPQLDNAERGFSFLKDGPLDMRMDTSKGLSAEQWLATVPEAQLVKVLFEYGEERYARRIAAAIVAERAIQPISTTRQLAKLIENTIPNKEKHKHPATRSFQAIRIEVNQELEEIRTALQQALLVLKPGGRLVVIAFHSLEDRLVKRFINDESGAKHHPGKLPIKEVDIAKGVLKKMGKAIKASDSEIQSNVRSRSAIMRVAEKVQ